MSTFVQVDSRVVGRLVVREYVAWNDGDPVDRFTLFYADGRWNAWISDTVNERRIEERREFAHSLGGGRS